MRVLLLIFLAVLTIPAQAQPFGETRQYFKDWLAACRSDGYCSATAYDNPDPAPAPGRAADYILRVGRQQQGEAWEISLTTIAAMPEQWEDLTVRVDDEQLLFGARRDYGAYDAVNDYFLLGQQAQILLEKMQPGSSLSVRFVSEAGTGTSARFSLSGLVASLLWIDEQQRRLGSQRIAGPAPPGLTPVSTDYPTILPRELIIQHAGDPDCEPFEYLANAGEILSGQVSEDEWLYFIPCTAGAYNYAYKAYQGYRGYFSPLYFARYGEKTGWTGTPFIVNPAYDAENKILTSYNKGRGLGDCGERGIWRWGEYGLAMIELRSKEVCDARGEAGIFPLVFKNRFPGATKPK